MKRIKKNLINWIRAYGKVRETRKNPILERVYRAKIEALKNIQGK